VSARNRAGAWRVVPIVRRTLLVAVAVAVTAAAAAAPASAQTPFPPAEPVHVSVGPDGQPFPEHGFLGDVSADGREVAFFRTAYFSDNLTDVYVRHVADGTTQQVSDGDAAAMPPALSADGEHLAYLRVAPVNDLDGPELVVVDLTDGSEVVVGPASHARFDLSADGSVVAYVVGTDVHVADLEAGTDDVVSPVPQFDAAMLSGDGRVVAFVGAPGAFLHDRDTGETEQLDDRIVHGLFLGDDAGLVAWGGGDEAQGQRTDIVVLDRTTGERDTVTSRYRSSFNMPAGLSDDGRRLGVLTRTGAGADCAVLDLENDLLAPLPERCHALQLSADGSAVAFSAAVDTTGGPVRTYLRATPTPFVAPTAEGRFVQGAYFVLLGRVAAEAEVDAWLDAGAARDRLGFAGALATSAEGIGYQLAGLYDAALSRALDDDGLRFWHANVARGMSLTEVGAHLFASREFYLNSGGTDGAFVHNLYFELIGRAPDAAGQRHWEQRLAAGADRFEVALAFYRSPESRSDRVLRLYDQVLFRLPDDAGWRFWTARLLVEDDLRLSAHLVASDEFFSRHA
jgi:hypothetical protein